MSMINKATNKDNQVTHNRNDQTTWANTSHRCPLQTQELNGEATMKSSADRCPAEGAYTLASRTVINGKYLFAETESKGEHLSAETEIKGGHLFAEAEIKLNYLPSATSGGHVRAGRGKEEMGRDTSCLGGRKRIEGEEGEGDGRCLTADELTQQEEGTKATGGGEEKQEEQMNTGSPYRGNTPKRDARRRRA